MTSARELGLALGGAALGAAAATLLCSGAATSATDRPHATVTTADANIPGGGIDAAASSKAAASGRPATTRRRAAAPDALPAAAEPLGAEEGPRTPPRKLTFNLEPIKRVPSASDELDLAVTPSRIDRLANSTELPVIRPLEIGGGGGGSRRRRPGWGRSRRKDVTGGSTGSGGPLQSGAGAEAAQGAASGADGGGSTDASMASLRSSKSLPQLAVIAKRNQRNQQLLQQELPQHPGEVLPARDDDDDADGGGSGDGDCRWVLPDDFQVGKAFSMRLTLGEKTALLAHSFALK
jgi:hypothetical protein